MEGIGMLRRVLVAGLLALSVAACGGSSPTASPVPDTPAPTTAPIVTPAPEPPAPPAESAAAGATTAKAACDAVSLRKTPSTTGELVGRAYLGTKIRIVETITGEAYSAGACGTSGDTWYKIDKVGGKTVKSLYGVQFVYSAAGFYE
jgi:hypothetical protein